MLIGIMSDSHDDMQRIRDAVALFNWRKAGHVIHAGDMVSPFTMDELGSLACPMTAIFGNNDGDRVLLTQRYGETMNTQPHIFTLDGKRFALVHEPVSVNALADSGHYDVVVYGHTHRPEVRSVAQTLVVNPGKTARLHKGASTVAFYDTETGKAELVEIP